MEDLEALVKLLSARALDTEDAADKLKRELTTAHAANDRATKEQLAISKQADSLKKEAAAAKRVCSLLIDACYQAVS